MPQHYNRSGVFGRNRTNFTGQRRGTARFNDAASNSIQAINATRGRAFGGNRQGRRASLARRGVPRRDFNQRRAQQMIALRQRDRQSRRISPFRDQAFRRGPTRGGIRLQPTGQQAPDRPFSSGGVSGGRLDSGNPIKNIRPPRSGPIRERPFVGGNINPSQGFGTGGQREFAIPDRFAPRRTF